MKKKVFQFFVGLLLFFGFTQIQWADIFFSTCLIGKQAKQLQKVEIDNSALFYTESEEARAVEFYLKKVRKN